jgi:hypothetical protein
MGRRTEKREHKLSDASFCKGTNPIMKAPPLWFLTLITSKDSISNTILVGVKASIYEFWGDAKFQSITIFIWGVSE